MKILVADFLFAEAHKDVNLNFIKAICEIANTNVVSLNGYYDDQKVFFQKNSIRLLEINEERAIGPIKSRIFSLNLMKKTAVFTREEAYDAVLCLGFETVTFGYGAFHFKDVPLFIFHHKNIDELTSKLKRFAFDGYKNKVYHVVFEEFFKKRLVNGLRISSDRVFVVPHPVDPTKSVHTDKKYNCIGLCNSNDENFIQEIISRDNDFLRQGFHILLRSKAQEKQDGAVRVIKGFMEKEVYDELMSEGKSVFVPLPKTYIYRLSGSIYDALSRGIPVLTNSEYYAQEYEQRYPGTCQFVSSVDQLIERLQKNEDNEASVSFKRFIEGHSVKTVSHEIENMVKTVMIGGKQDKRG